MADNESPTNITATIGYSAATGFLLFTFMILCWTINYQWMTTYVWFGIFLLLSFVIPFIFTLTAQASRCKGKVNIGAAAIGGFWSFLYILIGYSVAQLEFVRSIVESCYYGDELKNVKALEAEYPTAKYIAISYYVFFAAIIGQVQGGGMAITCPA